MTRYRRKTATILTGICLASVGILSGCSTESVVESTKDGAKSVYESATKCPEFDPNRGNMCLHRVCVTVEGQREYDEDCDKLRELDRKRSDEQWDEKWENR